MSLDEQLADLMVLVEPKLYRKHVRYSLKGEAVLYICITKALYSMLKSALWWYKELIKNLKTYDFEFNPYYPYVVNANINGKQMTVMWHVDDLKVSHMESSKLQKFGQYLRDIFGDALT